MRLGRSTRWIGLAAFAAWPLAALPVAVAQSSNAVRLEYDAPRGCPDAAAFVAEVHARSPRIRVEPAAPRALTVSLAPWRGGFAGTFALRETDAAAHQRTVSGARCDEVVSGLALVAAIAIDPDAATALAASAAASPASPASAAPAPAAGSAAAAASVDAQAGAGADAGEAAAEGAGGTSRAPRADGWAFALSANAEGVWGAAPDVLFAVPVSLELAWRTRGFFAPAVRARFVRAQGGTRSGGVGADFAFTVGDVDLCPVAWSPWRLRAQACARAELGLLEGEGVGVTPARSAARPFFALGPVLDVRLTLAGPLFLDAQGGLLFATLRDRYFLQPDVTVFDVPVAQARVGGGLGASFW